MEAQLPGTKRSPEFEEGGPEHSADRLQGFVALLRRQLRHWYRDPVLFLLGLIQPVVWLGLYGKAFPAGVAIPGTGDYFSFVSAGMLSFIVLFGSVFGGTTIVFDKQLGHLKRILGTPVARGSIVMSYVLTNTFKCLVQAAVLLAMALALGMGLSRVTVNTVGAVFAAEALLALGLSALFTMAGVFSGNSSTLLAVMNFIALPLMFASNSLFPIDAMPGWLQAVARLNPMSYANDAARQALLGSVGLASVPMDFAVLGGFAIGLSLLSIVLSLRHLSR